MAVTVTELTSNGSTSNTTNYATAAINPTANTLVLLAVHTTRGSSTDPVVPTVATAGGLTWVEIGNTLTQNSGTLRGRLTLFRAMASSPSSSVVTIQHSATMTGCMWSITQWDGVDTSGTNGSGAVGAQAAVFNRADASATVTMTLGSAVTSGNVVYAAAGHLGTMTWEEEGTWTELPATEITIATPDAKLGGAYLLASSDQSFTATSGSATEPGGVIVEIVAAAAGGTTYEKAGALTAGTVLAGADVAEHVETGALLTAARASGADVAEHVEAGSLTAGTRLSGADVAEHVETGALTARAVFSGVQEHVPAGGTTYEKTGALTAGASLSGADVSEFVEAGALTTATRLSGADVAEHVEAGSLATSTRLSGADVAEHVEAGSLTTSTRLTATDVSEFVETGALTTRAIFSGVATHVLPGGTTYEKTGALAAGTSTSGADAATFTEAGSLTAGAAFTGVSVHVPFSAFVFVPFGPPSPTGGMIQGTPNGGIGAGSPSGALAMGTPGGAFYGPPSPSQ